MSTMPARVPMTRASRATVAPASRWWRAAKAASVATAVTIVALLVIRPELGLFLTWKLLVPAVPALLLVAPGVWRNLCPIAVVHQLPASLGRQGGKRLGRRTRVAAPAIAALLLLTIVPLRLALFNEHGPALAAFVLVVLAVALVGGARFAGKSGWCATWCPVLPVERLYGQKPIVGVSHAHCASCSACVRSCYDLKPGRSLHALLGASHTAAPQRASLLRTPTGLFAAGFPGFVLGYFTTPAAAGVTDTYLRIAAFVAASIIAFATVLRLGRIDVRHLARAAAALAVAVYYWYTVPDVAAAAHTFLAIPPAPAAGIVAARAFFILLPAGWLVARRGADV